MNTVKVHVKGESAMMALAATVANYAEAGDFLALTGTLGMGKSTFARGFARALAGDDELAVPSPTFTLMQPYDETRLPFFHVDAYRLSDADELYALGLEDAFEHGMVLMEWPEKVAEHTPDKETPYRYPMESEFGARLDITITEADDESRYVEFVAWGSWMQRMGLILPEQTARAVTEEGRVAFLKEQNIEAPAVALSQDCSFRTYYRTTTAENNARIVMDAPPPMENIRTFLSVGNILKQQGTRVPEVYGYDVDKGYMLLEDFGGTVLAKAIQEGQSAKQWLEVAVDTLADWANKGAIDLPCPYSADSLWQEACRYTDWYLPAETDHATDVEDRKAFQSMWYKLYPYIDKLPKTFSHWDFHVENMMVLSETPSKENLGIIDFQDARFGSIAFDLCCLLEDRFPADAATKEQLINRYLEKLDADVNKEDFMIAYRICVAHRFLKITGLLERLERRDGRENVKGRMPQVWETIRWATAHPVLADIRAFLEQQSPNEMVESKAS